MDTGDLDRLERSTFRQGFDTGLWDLMLAAMVGVLAGAPLLSERLGDLGASAVFVPVWLGVFLGLREVHTRVLAPRFGVVRFGRERRRRNAGLLAALVVVNALAAGAGWLALRAGAGPGPQHLMISATLLAGFSAAAWGLGIPRYLAYGILLAAAPLVGVALSRAGFAGHSGYPLTFGVAASLMALAGLYRLAGRLRLARAHAEGLAGEGPNG